MRKGVILLIGLAGIILPAKAQISADDAMRICRNQVRQNASRRFGSTDTEFRSTSLTEDRGVRLRVEGTFVLRTDGQPRIHTFACSVDLNAANLRWAQVDNRNALNPEAGYAARTALSDEDLMDTCRKAVAAKIRDHGYIEDRINSILIESTPDGKSLITGSATGETAGHENVFRFSCRVDRVTGAATSVALNGH